MASFVRSNNSSIDFAWVWHPGSSTTSETYEPSSSEFFAVNALEFILRFSSKSEILKNPLCGPLKMELTCSRNLIKLNGYVDYKFQN